MTDTRPLTAAALLRSTATELEYQRAITGWLAFYRWRFWHETDSRKSPSGFPDLVATNGKTLLMVELKTAKGRVRREQQQWIDDLATVTEIISGIYRPDRSEDLYELIKQGKR